MAIPLLIGLTATSVYAEEIRIVLAETPSDELAIQAVLSGQIDIGFGTPYAAM